ncbi:hypothetical protein ACFQ1L_25205 [Phytohabitans flavus]|uniref:hypothetical protein n=1 Tax=Phytohabitans flavus TaxID=1076124 RepID=UPI001E472ABA|nr:hypothetical protein [Phytohabitans flavus]
MRKPDNRAAFLADEAAYMRAADLSDDEIDLVRQRDWTGLMRAGGHLQSVLKLAATVGQDLWHVGAHNAGCTKDELVAACPRRVTGLPGSDG